MNETRKHQQGQYVQDYKFLIACVMLIVHLSCPQELLSQEWVATSKVYNLQVSNKPLLEVLKSLNQKMAYSIVFGVDLGATEPGSLTPLISIDFEEASIDEVLSHVMAQVSEYEYSVSENQRLIMVFKKGSFLDLDNLLNVPVARFYIRDNIFPQTLVHAAPKFIAELGAAVKTRNAHFRTSADKPAGIVGSEMSGNVSGPLVELLVERKTVRDVLSAIAVWSHENAGALGWQRGFSWVYQCRRDVNSSSRLPCDPVWDIF